MADAVLPTKTKRFICGVLAFLLTFLLFFSWEEHTWHGALKAAIGVLFWGVVFLVMEFGWNQYRLRHNRKKPSPSNNVTRCR